MIIPLNLSLDQVQQLRKSRKHRVRNFYIEEVSFGDRLVEYISPLGEFKEANRKSFAFSRDNISGYSNSDIVALFDLISEDDINLLLQFLQETCKYYAVIKLSTNILMGSFKRLYSSAVIAGLAVYSKCSYSAQKKFRRAIIESLNKSTYASLLKTLEGILHCLLPSSPSDVEWRFIEGVVQHSIYIKSPEITELLSELLDKIKSQRNIVLYCSCGEDEHYTKYINTMERGFFLLIVDPELDLYASPQHYSMPLENFLLLFDVSSVVWWRKPSRLGVGETSLEQFTKQEIVEFIKQCKTKFSHKIFPQYLENDQKFVYFALIREYLILVNTCDSYFENSTFFWSTGDFIKPLASQAILSSSGYTERTFSPFIFDADKEDSTLSIMPPMIRQVRLHKEFEVRGTFFLDEVSTVKIDTQRLAGEKANIDWRYSKGLFQNMTEYTLPKDILNDLTECFQKLKLRFCTFDLVYTGSKWYLLDINYNGQWIFSDEFCALKITRKILSYLSDMKMANTSEISQSSTHIKSSQAKGSIHSDEKN